MMRSSETNPYQSPTPALLQYKPVYAWPYSTDHKLEADVFVGKDELKKCLKADFGLTMWPRIGVTILFVVFAISFLTTIQLRDVLFLRLWLVGGACCMLWMLPSTLPAWHFRQTNRRYPWLWGQVHVTLNANGITWQSRDVEIEVLWDNLSEIGKGDSCLWFSSAHPFACKFPIHRDWIESSMWNELCDIWKSHPAGYEFGSASWNLGKPKPSKFSGCASPELTAIPAGSDPFCSKGSEAYSCEARDGLLRFGREVALLGFLLIVLLPILASPFGYDLTWLTTWFNPIFFGWQAIQVSLPILLLYRSFGISVLQRSQGLLSSQNGYVSSDAIFIATPAYSMKIRRSPSVTIRQTRSCMLVRLAGNRDATLVIPLDQFATKPVW